MYKLEQTRVGKCVRLEIQRQNVMTNLVQWISQKKRGRIVTVGVMRMWWDKNCESHEEGPNGSSRKISISVHLEPRSTIIIYCNGQIKIVVLGCSGSEVYVAC